MAMIDKVTYTYGHNRTEVAFYRGEECRAYPNPSRLSVIMLARAIANANMEKGVLQHGVVMELRFWRP